MPSIVIGTMVVLGLLVCVSAGLLVRMSASGERASTAMLLGTLWVALATCVLAALAYEIRFWVPGW